MPRRLFNLLRIGTFCLLYVCNINVQAYSYPSTDSIKVMKLLKEVKDSFDIDRDKSLTKLLDAIEMSRASDFKRGLAKGLQQASSIYMQKGKYDSAVNLANESIKICAANNFSTTEIDAYIDLGIIYDFLGDYKSATESYQNALSLSGANTDGSVMMSLYANFGDLMLTMEDYESAKKYFSEALKLGIAINKPINIAKAYLKLGIANLYQEKYKDEFLYMNRCIRICDSIHIKGPVGVAYQGLGIYYADSTGQYDSARYYYEKSIAVYKAKRDTFNEAGVLCNLGNLYFMKLHQIKEAEKYYMQSRELGIKSSNIQNVADCDNSLALLYEQAGNYKKAYEHRTSQLNFRDSLYNKEKIGALEGLNSRINNLELQNKNTSLQKETDIQRLRLQHRDILLYGGAAFIILLIASSFLLIRHNKLRANQKLMRLEQKQLLSQINPHFIFNCLNSVQQFVVQNDIENANKYLADFAMLMRQTLDNSERSVILLSKELDYLENYLSLESMRFENLFSYKISCSEDVDCDIIEIPSMVIQPYVENAISHGFTNLEEKKGILNIRFYRKNDSLFCEVDDNGIGMKQSEEIKKQMIIKHESKGMEMTRLRLALVSKLNGVDYQVTVVNKSDGKGEAEGTTIIIKFPFKA